MDRQRIYAIAKQNYGTEPDYPWSDWNAVLRHRKSRKWYAVILEVDKEKLGLPGSGMVDILNVKCDARLVGSLRKQEGFHAAYHMNREKWISIRLDGSVPEDEVRFLLQQSYELTDTGKKRCPFHETETGGTKYGSADYEGSNFSGKEIEQG